jgi:hypothetical protein
MRIYGCKRKEAAGDWRGLHVMKARKMRQEEHVTHMGEMKVHITFWSENLKGRDHLEDLGVYRRVMLK